MSQLTKKAIISSFITLLNQKPLDKITVKDIVEDCGINRKTFYYHFEDIYDLLRYILAQESERFYKERTEDETLEQLINRLADFAFKNKKAMQHIYNSVDRDILEKELFKIVYPEMTKFVIKRSENTPHKDIDVELLSRLFSVTFTGAILHVLRDGIPENHETAVKKISVMLTGCISFALNNLYEAGL